MSSFGTAELLGRDLIRLGRRLILPVNPHIKYLDLAYHVYTKATVTSGAMDIQYIAVNAVAQPTSPAFLLQRFTVPYGEPRLIFQ